MEDELAVCDGSGRTFVGEVMEALRKLIATDMDTENGAEGSV